MEYKKTKSLVEIERRMENLPQGSFRFRVLEAAGNFKKSWIVLGQALYTVYKDKAYKEWGYTAFDIYAVKELGIKKETSLKLLRSYKFLESEEPALLVSDSMKNPSEIPSYETVNVLRLAKNNKKLQLDDYTRLRESAFNKGKDVKELKSEFRSILRDLEDEDPVKAREKRRKAYIVRLLNTLKTLKNEISTAKLLSAPILNEVGKLIDKLEAELK